MHILGISTLGETSAAIAYNGQLLAAAEQERFNRERHTHAFPEDAIQYCLERIHGEMAVVTESVISSSLIRETESEPFSKISWMGA